MKIIEIEILDDRAREALGDLESKGWIRLVSKGNKFPMEGPTPNKDLDAELARRGFSMQEIVDEVKKVRG